MKKNLFILFFILCINLFSATSHISVERNYIVKSNDFQDIEYSIRAKIDGHNLYTFIKPFSDNYFFKNVEDRSDEYSLIVNEKVIKNSNKKVFIIKVFKYSELIEEKEYEIKI